MITNSYATGEVGDGWVKSWGGGIQSLERANDTCRENEAVKEVTAR